MAYKGDKSKIFVRIMAAFLAFLMVLGFGGTIIYYLISL